MRITMRKAIKRLLAFAMVLAVGTTALGVTEAKAAANKALQVSFSFDGMNDNNENDPAQNEKCWFNNSYAIYVAGSQKVVPVKGLKTSADIYIPKKVLDKKGSRVSVSTYMDLFDKKGDYVGAIEGLISIDVENENGKLKVYAWDNKKNKNVKVGSYATCKAGKGAYKSYYVIRLKNLPGKGEIALEGGDTKKLTSSTKYGFNMGVSVCGINYKGSGKFYVDNIKTTSGKKTVASQDFTKKPKYYGVVNKDKELKKSKAKIVTF